MLSVLVNGTQLLQCNLKGSFEQGCDIAYFFVRMRRFFLALDTIDDLCLLYSK